jgi:hypothetical protein
MGVLPGFPELFPQPPIERLACQGRRRYLHPFGLGPEMGE